jgi:hypothetical protein
MFILKTVCDRVAVWVSMGMGETVENIGNIAEK